MRVSWPDVGTSTFQHFQSTAARRSAQSASMVFLNGVWGSDSGRSKSTSRSVFVSRRQIFESRSREEEPAGRRRTKGPSRSAGVSPASWRGLELLYLTTPVPISRTISATAICSFIVSRAERATFCKESAASLAPHARGPADLRREMLLGEDHLLGFSGRDRGRPERPRRDHHDLGELTDQNELALGDGEGGVEIGRCYGHQAILVAFRNSCQAATSFRASSRGETT